MNVQQTDGRLLAASCLIIALGGIILVTSLMMPTTQMYSQISSSLFPAIVGAAMLLCGVLMAYQSIRGGWACEVVSEDARHFEFATLAWILAGYAAAIALLVLTDSFVLAGTVLYVLAYRAFANGGWRMSVAVGFILSCLAYIVFAI